MICLSSECIDRSQHQSSTRDAKCNLHMKLCRPNVVNKTSGKFRAGSVIVGGGRIETEINSSNTQSRIDQMSSKKGMAYTLPQSGQKTESISWLRPWLFIFYQIIIIPRLQFPKARNITFIGRRIPTRYDPWPILASLYIFRHKKKK